MSGTVSIGTFTFEPEPSEMEITEGENTTEMGIINGELNSGSPTIENQFLGVSPEEIRLEGQLVEQSEYPNLGGTAGVTAQINDLKALQREDTTHLFFASNIASEDVYMSNLDLMRDRGEKGYEYEIELVKG